MKNETLDHGMTVKIFDEAEFGEFRALVSKMKPKMVLINLSVNSEPSIEDFGLFAAVEISVRQQVVCSFLKDTELFIYFEQSQDGTIERMIELMQVSEKAGTIFWGGEIKLLEITNEVVISIQKKPNDLRMESDKTSEKMFKALISDLPKEEVEISIVDMQEGVVLIFAKHNKAIWRMVLKNTTCKKVAESFAGYNSEDLTETFHLFNHIL